MMHTPRPVMAALEHLSPSCTSRAHFSGRRVHCLVGCSCTNRPLCARIPGRHVQSKAFMCRLARLLEGKSTAHERPQTIYGRWAARRRECLRLLAPPSLVPRSHQQPRARVPAQERRRRGASTLTTETPVARSLRAGQAARRLGGSRSQGAGWWGENLRSWLPDAERSAQVADACCVSAEWAV